MENLFIYESNEEDEAYISLLMFYESIKFLKKRKNSIYWKFAIISLHNSIQCWMVCALKSTNGFDILKNKKIKQPDGTSIERTPYKLYEERLNNKSDNYLKFDEFKLKDFLELYELIKKDEYPMKQYINSEYFKATHKDNEAMEWLNYTRNEFIHFTPKLVGWYFGDAPEKCLLILNIIYFLIKNSNNVHIFHEGISVKTDNLMNQIRNLLNELIEIKD